MNHPPFKRKANPGGVDDGNSRKMPKKMTFAERMMAKMGHKEGEGLGKTGEGIVNPIEVNVRPQNVGLGAVREKTKQANEEDKRRAKQRGEEVEDSSDEERKARKRRQQRQAGGVNGGSGTSTPRTNFAKPKIRYQTAADLEEAAEGLEIPNIFKDIIDATGKERKLLTSGEGIFTNATNGTAAIESEKLKSRARKEVEAFVESWNHLKERQKDIDMEEEQEKELASSWDTKVKAMEEMIQAARALSSLQINGMDSEEQQWEQLTASLEDLQSKFAGNDEEELDTTAVAAIQPLFKRAMADWHPLDEPARLTPYLTRLYPLLAPKRDSVDGENGQVKRKKSTTPYESLIYKTWLPKVRSDIAGKWNPNDPAPLLSLFEAWKPILPESVADMVINTLVAEKLVDALQSWNARTAAKRKSSKHPLPHIWIFPWLQYLSPYHLNPHASTSFLSHLNRRLRAALDSWDVSAGVMPGLLEWTPLLGNVLQSTLIKHILPRLATHLRLNFEVYPPDQDLTPLEQVLLWKDLLPLEATARLLAAEFFPKWLLMLHAWLTGESPNFDEIQDWLAWWKQQIPAELNELQAISDEWQKGNKMIADAINLYAQDADLGLLAPPVAGPSRPLVDTQPSTPVRTPVSQPTKRLDDPPTFRDIVEQWCEEESLLLIPLREAHESTGLPLFRMTASATGKGGIIIYLKGDIVFGQKNKGDRSAWRAFELGDELLKRAESR